MTPPAAKNAPPRPGFQTLVTPTALLEETGAKSSKGWKTVPLGDITETRVDKTGPTGREFTYIDIGSVELETKRIVEPKVLLTSQAPSRAKQVLKHGDVLVSMTRPNRNAVALIPPEFDGAIGSTGFHVLRVRDAEPGFIFYAVQTNDFIDALCEKVQGALYPAVRPRDISSFKIFLPLPSEQKQIVAEIEKQFTRLEAGVSALKRVQANLKRYRAAVLKAACEGRIFPSDLSAWKQLKVWEIGEAITGNTPPTSDEENLGDELPFFKPTDLDAGYNVREARQYLSAKGAKLSRVLPAGAVLVTCIGATIGKTGFARVDCATNQQINALVVNPQIAIPQWAFLLFSSPVGQQQIKNNASATTLPILNKSKFSALEFPIPPLAEQVRIVAEVERRLSVVEELEAVVSANLQRATRLRQSILQKAFSGELA